MALRYLRNNRHTSWIWLSHECSYIHAHTITKYEQQRCPRFSPRARNQIGVGPILFKTVAHIPRLAGGGALNAPSFFAALYLRNGAPQARQILGTCCELIAVYDSEVLKISV